MINKIINIYLKIFKYKNKDIIYKTEFIELNKYLILIKFYYLNKNVLIINKKYRLIYNN